MSTGAGRVRNWDQIVSTLQSAATVGDLRQMSDGSAAVFLSGDPLTGASSGQRTTWESADQVTLPKQTGVVLLDGGRAYWDHSAGVVTYRQAGDQDFYLGRVVGDAAGTDAQCVVNLNVDPPYDRQLDRDPYYTAAVGTQALGGFLPTQRRGGALKLLLSATNEAQKVDALGKDGFSVDANAVIEFAVEVVSLGAGGAPDFNVGIASGTNATDADAIAQHLLCHVNGNSGAIKFQSKDGTHTTAAADSLQTLTAGTRFEVWVDTRDPTNVALYVNGVRVLGGTAFDISAGANPWFLLAHLEKTAAADVFEADVDWLRARFAEQ